MTIFKKVLFGVFGVYLFTALPLAHAMNSGTDEHFSKGRYVQRIHEIFSRLNLTDKQKKLLEANKQQHRARMQSAHRKMKADMEAMRRELMKPRLDMMKINGIHDRIKALQSHMEDIKFSSILAVRAILTPEQFSKFINLIHKHIQGHRD